jgi:hypothetical protein
MLDYRAWIAACLILVSASGAYLFWLHRTRALYTARSLTAPRQPSASGSQPVTDTLHVEGCEKNFIVKRGELVEPRVVPDAPLDQFRSVYGKEMKRESKDFLSWDQYAFTLTRGYYGAESLGNSVDISVNQGHVVQTLDGVELGIDSFGTILRKMRDQNIAVHQRIDRPEGNWTLFVSFYSACGHKYRSEYSRTIPGSAEIDKMILPPANDPAGSGAPWRSDVFMNKVVFDYDLVASNGRDDSGNGTPAERH